MFLFLVSVLQPVVVNLKNKLIQKAEPTCHNLPSTDNSDDINMNAQVKEGFYIQELNKTCWSVKNRYQDLNHIGSGAFGQVCSAADETSEQRVALKRLSRPFQSFEHAKRTYREIKLLTFMNHENVIDLLNVFSPADSYDEFQDVYLVFSYIGPDLNTYIRRMDLEQDQIQLILYQVIRALKYVHSAGIIHRDLKPSNIVVSPDIEVKLIDFGLARLGQEEMTGYVATRYYRAPEIMLNWMHYGSTADLWSVGCILAEMLMGKTLFPGADHLAQLHQILSLVGTPAPELLQKLTSEYGRKYIESLPHMPRQDFSRVFPGVDQQTLDLLAQLLQLDPDARLTAEAALAHPFFGLLSDPDDEPVSARVFTDPRDSNSTDSQLWRQLVYELVLERARQDE